jgi:outer membrane protein OmpA-like peptidoglycan-associated protein
VVDSASGTWIAAISLAKKENIVITIKKDSVAFNSKVVDIKNLTAQSAPINIPIAVMKAEKDKSYIINDIHYETNSADIEQRSKLILQSFAEYLVENPNLYVEIQGHTDNKGNPKDNLALSTDRAYSVKSYLENFKVNGKRITAKGYGQEKPLADNGTEAGRAQNRRTEFLIVEH